MLFDSAGINIYCFSVRNENMHLKAEISCRYKCIKKNGMSVIGVSIPLARLFQDKIKKPAFKIYSVFLLYPAEKRRCPEPVL